MSFSIKPKEEQPIFPLKPALPQELSSDDESGQKDTPADQPKVIESAELKLTNLPLPTTNLPTNGILSESSQAKLNEKLVSANKSDIDLSESSLRDAMLESNSPTIDEKREAKRGILS